MRLKSISIIRTVLAEPPLNFDDSKLLIKSDSLQTRREPSVLGWLPVLSLFVSLGLLLVSIADFGGRTNTWGSLLFFWLGLLAMLIPVIVRLLFSSASKSERLSLIVLLTFGLYMVKFLNSPLTFTIADEYGHWRTANDILLSGHLFHSNPVVPASAPYPGLEIVTTALINLTGLTIFQAGNLIICLGHVGLILALYLLYEYITKSAKIAGIAAVIYLSNPNFLFFDAMFSYESLALFFLAICLLLYCKSILEYKRFWFYGLVLFTLGATLITHHLTSYALVAFLGISFMFMSIPEQNLNQSSNNSKGFGKLVTIALDSLRAKVTKNRSDRWLTKFISKLEQALRVKKTRFYLMRLGIIMIIVMGCVVWLKTIGHAAMAYSTYPKVAATELINVVLNRHSGRQLFVDATGHSAPLWERLTSFAAVGLILIGILYGLIVVWRRYRTNSFYLVFALYAIGYIVSLTLRLTSVGSGMSARAAEFVFIGVAPVISIGIAELLFTKRHYEVGSKLLLSGFLTICFVGGILIGWPPWLRLPGPYLIAADGRSYETEGADTASWFLQKLGPHNIILTDRVNRQIMGTYGEQDPVMNDGLTAPMFVIFNPNFGSTEVQMLQQRNIHYLVIDKRLSTGLPMSGVYFEEGEPFTNLKPLDLALLTKFDFVVGSSRIFDSGDIQVFDVSQVTVHSTSKRNLR